MSPPASRQACHQAHLAVIAAGQRIVGAFDRHDRIDELERYAVPQRFCAREAEIQFHSAVEFIKWRAGGRRTLCADDAGDNECTPTKSLQASAHYGALQSHVTPAVPEV